jgi:hypothetical protein
MFISHLLVLTTEPPVMKLFFLLIALAALAVSCLLISNDFYYLGNPTHTTADLVRDTLEKQSNNQPQLG